MEREENTFSEAETLHSQILNIQCTRLNVLPSPQLTENKEPILSDTTALKSNTYTDYFDYFNWFTRF